jgi:hypothetical protein
MKTYLGIVIGVAYAIGFFAVQVHLLRFGILDISPLQAYYLLVGLWFLLCISPALVVIGAAEYLLSSVDSIRVKLIVLLIGTTIIVASVGAAAQLSAHKMVLNFNAYPYAYWYTYWNLTVMNLHLISVWLLCFAYSRLRAFKRSTRKVAAIVGAIVVANAVIFFGRTVYPALDRGVGGGAPQFVQVTETNNKRHVALQVYAGEDHLYLLELAGFPPGFENRSAMTQFAVDSKGPVYKALVDNQVLKLNNNQVRSVRMHGLKQKEDIDKYLEE